MATYNCGVDGKGKEGVNKKKLLMIAYYFPPLGGSGALRPFKLAKYFPAYGWDPVVLTVKNPDWYYAHDSELLTELPPEVKIVRGFMLRSSWLYRIVNPLRNVKLDSVLRNFIVQPDDQAGWIAFGCHKAWQILRKTKIDALYSTSAPISCHLIAYFLHRQTGIPWVADFRDEWFENPDMHFPTRFHRSFHYKLERLIVRNSSKVVGTSPVFCQMLSKHSSDIKKFVTITMGYDPADFPSVSPILKSEKNKKKFIIVFSGLFYGTFRPTNILKAAEELIDEGKISANQIKFQFIGANTPNEIGLHDRYKICEFSGFISHKTAIQYLHQADLLLLLLSRLRGAGVVPSKTFEYMASGKPILAIVPSESCVAKIIERTNSGVVVDFLDFKAIKNALYAFYQQWVQGNFEQHPKVDQIARFEQTKITRKFVKVLEGISA